MIYVNRQANENVVSAFMKRVKKFNLVSRKRKTQVEPPKLSKLRKKRKALQKIAYDAKKKMLEKVSKI
jgi:hypothetical protein